MDSPHVQATMTGYFANRTRRTTPAGVDRERPDRPSSTMRARRAAASLLVALAGRIDGSPRVAPPESARAET